MHARYKQPKKKKIEGIRQDALRLDISMALSKIKTKPRGHRDDTYGGEKDAGTIQLRRQGIPVSAKF